MPFVLKAFIKRVLPKSLTSYLNWFRIKMHESRHYWQGIYKNYNDVPQFGNGYFEENLAQETFTYTQSMIDGLKRDKTIPYNTLEENSFLPLVSSLIFRERSKLNILELGGGMGAGFLSLLSCLEDHSGLNYFIIETPNMCKGGRELFKNDSRIKFYSEFPVGVGVIDVIFVKSALQYFKDYSLILKNLASYNSKYFLFVKFSAGENPTYLSAQTNLTGTVTPFWFLNIDEVKSTMSSLGYSLVYKSVLDRVYNQDNFPLEYQMKKNCNLLFIKE